jgi:rRNA-processing protein FCF1
MFDTSIFNFIDRHDLYSGLESFLGNNKGIQVYITPTQVDEVNAISDASKRARILGLIHAISAKKVAASLGVAGLDESSPHKFGYKGPRVGEFRVAEVDESKPEEIEKLRGSIKKNPLGEHTADTTILDTAITENMDYLITADRRMKTKLPGALKKVRIYSRNHPELKVELINNRDDLMNFLKNCFN